VWPVAGGGALSCLYVMRGLPSSAWKAFAIWMVIGLAIYFLYGYRKSHLGRGLVEVHETDRDVPPPPVPPIS
jgi:APA family basic amino acid/polyamine antiporter